MLPKSCSRCGSLSFVEITEGLNRQDKQSFGVQGQLGHPCRGHHTTAAERGAKVVVQHPDAVGFAERFGAPWLMPPKDGNILRE